MNVLEQITESLNDLRDWISENLEIFIAAVLTSIFVIFIAVILFQPTKPVEMSGYLVGKEYSPSSTSTGIGSGIDSSGKPITVVTTSSKSEEWTVVLNIEGKYKTFSVSPDVYYSVEIDKPVTLFCSRGKWIPFVDCKTK